jgi:Ser/Thr protein kinase RdoA (MazF antagonist)
VHRWVSDSKRLGFVPVPIPALDGRTLIHHADLLWELSPWMPGETDLSRPPRTDRLRAGFAALAAFHQNLAAEHRRGRSPGLARRALEIDNLMRGGFLELEEAVNQRATDSHAQTARTWLALARPQAPSVAVRLDKALEHSVLLQPCLRDVRSHHLLFEGSRLTGLVDFGAMDVDTVAGDLARLLLEWVGPDRAARADALSAYTAVRPLDTTETTLIDAFEVSACLLTGGHWLRWHFVEGRTFDDPQAVRTGLERGLERLNELISKRLPI